MQWPFSLFPEMAFSKNSEPGMQNLSSWEKKLFILKEEKSW